MYVKDQKQESSKLAKIIGSFILFIIVILVAFYMAYWFITNYMMDNQKQTYYVQTMT